MFDMFLNDAILSQKVTKVQHGYYTKFWILMFKHQSSSQLFCVVQSGLLM
jgi:hypothetical protein